MAPGRFFMGGFLQACKVPVRQPAENPRIDDNRVPRLFARFLRSFPAVFPTDRYPMQPTSGTPRTSAAFLLLALAFVINMMGTTLPTAVYRYYRIAYGFTPATITVIYACYAFGVLAALLMVGNWSDQLGRKRMLTCGLFASAASA